MVQIILVRHGQTAWNEGAGQKRFRGRTELRLDATGQSQARAVAARLASKPLAAIYVSPLLRAQQTIAPLAAEKSMEIQTHDGLLDIDYGRFQGLSHSEAEASHPELYALWRTAPSQVRFPDGEGLVEVQTRLLQLISELVDRHPDETVVLVGHQIVNKVLTCTLLNLDLDQIWHIHLGTGGISVFQQVDSDWDILSLNDTCHLPNTL